MPSASLSILSLAAFLGGQEANPALAAPLQELERPADTRLGSPARSGHASHADLVASVAANPALYAPEPSAPVDFDIEDGTHWARGSDYKASFGPAGAAFVPFLGSQAPRNFPLAFAPASLRRGSTTLGLEPGAVRREGMQVRILQGSLESVYDLDASGMEQSFYVADPGSRGDLVLDLDLESELIPRPEGESWVFEGPFGGVRYGAAFAFDASGAPLPVMVEVTTERLRFTIPGHDLEQAEWPVKIDPYISTNAVDTGSLVTIRPDVTFDFTSQRYFVVFEEIFSATDGDINSYYLQLNGTPVGLSGVRLDGTTVNRRRPRAACVTRDRQFMAVFEHQDASNLPLWVDARSRHCDNSVLGTTFRIDANVGAFRDQPDICGDSNDVAAASFIVVYRRKYITGSSAVLFRVVASNGTFVTGEQTLTSTTTTTYEQPAICSAISPNESDAMVVMRNVTSTGGHQILATAIRRGGALWHTLVILRASNAGLPLLNPEVSGLGLDGPNGGTGVGAVATWEVDYGADRDIEAAGFVLRAGTTPVFVAPSQSISAMEPIDLFVDQAGPRIACVGTRWVVTYANETGGAPPRYDLRATTLNFVGDRLGLTEASTRIQGSSPHVGQLATSSRWENGFTGAFFPDTLTVFTSATSPTAQPDLWAARYDAYANLGAGIQFCPTNENSTNREAYLYVEGNATATGTKRMRISQLPIASVGYLLASRNSNAGTQPANSSGFLCLAAPIGRYSAFVQNSGNTGAVLFDVNPSLISQPSGSVAAVPGETWNFQYWYRDVGAGGVPTSNFTNACAVPID